MIFPILYRYFKFSLPGFFMIDQFIDTEEVIDTTDNDSREDKHEGVSYWNYLEEIHRENIING